MSKPARLLAAMVLVTTMTLLAPVRAGAASATVSAAAVCDDTVNPATATSKRTQASKTVRDGRTLTLRSGTLLGTQYAWTQLSATRAGDTIWAEVSSNGPRPPAAVCVMFAPSGPTDRNYTRGLPTSADPQVCMRAGFRTGLLGVPQYTPWWC